MVDGVAEVVEVAMGLRGVEEHDRQWVGMHHEGHVSYRILCRHIFVPLTLCAYSDYWTCTTKVM